MNPIYILAVALLISLSCGSGGMELSLSGHATGTGYNETMIECPDCNITANTTSWQILMESPIHDIFG